MNSFATISANSKDTQLNFKSQHFKFIKWTQLIRFPSFNKSLSYTSVMSVKRIKRKRFVQQNEIQRLSKTVLPLLIL